MSKTEIAESDKESLYDPEKIFLLSTKWRRAIINGWIKEKPEPLTDDEKAKLIEKQKCLDMIKEIIWVMNKVSSNKDSEYYNYLLDGYYLACENVWQRFEEIDNDMPQSKYAKPKQLKMPAHKRTMVDSIPYYRQDLEEWLESPKKRQEMKKYRNLVEQIPTLLNWKEYSHYLFFGRPDDLSLYEPFDDAIASYICILHRDCIF